MSSKIRIERDPNELDEEYLDILIDGVEQRTIRTKYTGKRRRDIEDLVEEKRLKKQIDDYYEERL